MNFKVNQDSLSEIVRLKSEVGEQFPKIGILVVSFEAQLLIEKTLKRIPEELWDCLFEVFVFDDASQDLTYEKALQVKSSLKYPDKLSVFKNPTNLGYGGNQINGYNYALSKQMDCVVMLHGDGQYAPEFLPDLILPYLKEDKEVVFGSRMINKLHAIKGGMPVYKWLGNQVLTKLENFILGTDLSEFHSGYRLYSTKVLKRLPFELNTYDFHFDTQIIIQCRAARVEIHEVPIKTHYGDEVCNVNGLKYAKDVIFSVIKYRLHQLHIIRRSRYLIKNDVIYGRKLSPFSSHGQILGRIDKPGTALDLGSSNGLLLKDLKEKGVDVICVDALAPDQVSVDKEAYIQADLEDFEKVHLERKFDYIIMADIIEHIRNAGPFVHHASKFLKEDGKLIVSVPNIAIWFYRLSLLVGRFNYGDKGILDRTHVMLYTYFSIEDFLKSCNYKVTKKSGTSLPFEVLFESVGKSRTVKFIDWTYYQLVKFWPTLFSYQAILECQISSYDYAEGEGKIV